jgi:hypothetical protein
VPRVTFPHSSAQVWTCPYRFGGADLLSHPGARGGLDTRLGASLDPREDLSPDPNLRTAGANVSPVQFPAKPGRATALPRLDAKGSADVSSEDGHTVSDASSVTPTGL